MTREEIIRNIREKKVIAIVRGFHPKQCIQLAEALYAGGINMIEVTFDQSGPDTWGETVEAIQAIWENFGGRVLPGAGTVMTVEQVNLAKRPAPVISYHRTLTRRSSDIPGRPDWSPCREP